MKKNHKYGAWYSPVLKKCLLIMRLVLVISLISIMQTFALNAYTQNTKISLSVTEIRLEEIIMRIESDTYYRFAYDKNEIDVDRNYSIDIQNAEVKELLNKLFSKGEINYTIVGRQIVLSPSKSTEALSQQKSISGKVTDSSGSPLPGVTVVVKGTTQGTITGTDGNYSLSNVPGDVTLVFSFVGMKTQEMPVSGKTSMNVTMIEETVGIEEVVAIGYGTTSKRKLTSAVSTVKGEDIADYPISNTLQALEGRAKGVITMGQGGEPGTLPTISIRGGGEPLYVIDGIPSSKEEFAGISPTDIESFSILKDASAAAVYGARAGNGIVMVTTKKGNLGNIKITYNTSVSFSSPTTPIKFLSPQRTAEAFDKASLYNGGLVSYMDLDENGDLYWDLARLDSLNKGILIKNLGVTDWSNMIMNKFAPSQTHDIAMSGGTKSTRYYMSGRYSEQNGIFKNDVSYSKRYTMRMNMSHEFENIGLKVTGDVSLNQQDKKMPPSSLWTIMTSLMRQNSLGRIFNQEGNPTGGPENPYLMIDPKGGYKKSNYKYLNTRLTFDWAVPFVKGLSFQVFGNYRWYDEFHKNWYANASGVGQSWDNLNQKEDMGPAHLDQHLIRSHDYNFESRINYLKTFAEHHTVQATFVYNEWAENYSYMDAARSGYQTTVIEQLNGGPSSTATNAGSESEHARRGIIGRLKYDYNTKYILEANFRYDGSDKFPKGSRWGFFPSVSVGWNIDQENFIQNIQSLSSLKLRASWGEIGLDDVGDFQYLSVFNAGHDFYQDGKWTPTLSEGNLGACRTFNF
jgi:TonB-linked SusC/RagA family outer membrane protein